MNLMASIAENLMPCPFCGSDDEVELVPLYNEDGREAGGAIRCSSCGSTFTHPEAATHVDLIAHWNERPCDKCYPELGYCNTKMERDAEAVKRMAENRRCRK